METSRTSPSLAIDHRKHGITILSLIVAVHGILIITFTLLTQFVPRHLGHIGDLVVDLPLLVGLSLLYLSIYLKRRKRTAWLVTIVAYTFYLGINLEALIDHAHHDVSVILPLRVIVLPLAILSLLLLLQREFIVRSDTQGFKVAARFSVVVLLIAFIYGVTGFQLMDRTDFHREIPIPTAVHYTIDQFDLTTNHPLHPYTKRAHLFLDSLSFVSIMAIIYAAFSLFQPLRSRFGDQTAARERMSELLRRYHGSSEDYFKIWPHDKHYFFDISGRAGIAYQVYRGIALCLGDPAGDPRAYQDLFSEFHDECFNNDWLPAYIHILNKHRSLYESHGYLLQKIGQEAVVDIGHFLNEVARNKYFRHIGNKFQKQHYTTEVLSPPHHEALIHRLRTISDEWLTQPGRVERGFAMGYFSPEYLQQCRVMVVRDAAGTIQAFLNQIPASFDQTEATYDLLRQTTDGLSNVTDFLLIEFMRILQQEGYRYLNLGLCPLAGLEDIDAEEKSFLDNLLRFAYANGNRIYSFSGLYRFKAKYEPEWRDRYVAYKGGVAGFSRTMTMLTRAMRVKRLRKS